MKAKLCLLALAGVMLASCGGNNATTSVLSGDTSTRSIPAWSNPFAGIGTEEVELLVWAGETQESIDFVKNAAAEFKRDNPQSNYTVAMGLMHFITNLNIGDWFGAFAAGSVLVSIPLSLLFMFVQRYYVGGVTGGAVKG